MKTRLSTLLAGVLLALGATAACRRQHHDLVRLERGRPRVVRQVRRGMGQEGRPHDQALHPAGQHHRQPGVAAPAVRRQVLRHRRADDRRGVARRHQGPPGRPEEVQQGRRVQALPGDRGQQHGGRQAARHAFFTDAGCSSTARTCSRSTSSPRPRPGTNWPRPRRSRRGRCARPARRTSRASSSSQGYEGLTCDALEWVASFGGGEIIDKAGNITINNPKAAKALDTRPAGSVHRPGRRAELRRG